MKASSRVMSQPIMSGAPTRHQSETCVYCSFGVRREPLKPFQCILPTQSMSGSFHAPGFDHGQSAACFWMLS